MRIINNLDSNYSDFYEISVKNFFPFWTRPEWADYFLHYALDAEGLHILIYPLYAEGFQLYDEYYLIKHNWLFFMVFLCVFLVFLIVLNICIEFLGFNMFSQVFSTFSSALLNDFGIKYVTKKNFFFFLQKVFCFSLKGGYCVFCFIYFFFLFYY